MPAPGALLHGTRRGVRLAGGTTSLRWIGSRIEDFAAVIDLPSPARTFRFELEPRHSLTLEAGFAWGSSFSAAIVIPPGACGQRHPAHAGQSPAAARQGLPGRSVRRARGRHAGDPGSAVHPPRRHAAHSAAPVGHCRQLRLPNPTDPECFGSGDWPECESPAGAAVVSLVNIAVVGNLRSDRLLTQPILSPERCCPNATLINSPASLRVKARREHAR